MRQKITNDKEVGKELIEAFTFHPENFFVISAVDIQLGDLRSNKFRSEFWDDISI